MFVLLYIDPGSGNIMIQLIVAAVAGALYSVKSLRMRIQIFLKDLFNRKKNKGN